MHKNAIYNFRQQLLTGFFGVGDILTTIPVFREILQDIRRFHQVVIDNGT
ncbi:MAG: hypothetical protein IPL78_08075 [Chloroflexi bacterium]|nr:hypothetical protein [Chloroflexota bacterium]